MNVFRKNTSNKSSAQSVRDVSQRNQLFRLTKADKVLDKKSVDNIIGKLTDLRVDPDGKLRKRVIEKLKEYEQSKKQQSMSSPMLALPKKSSTGSKKSSTGSKKSSTGSKKSSTGSKKSSASSSKNSVFEADKYLPLLKYTNF
jgi:hypothetical protein